MAYYGEIINKDYDPIKEDVYKLFVKYFGNPVMTKIKDINSYTMYMTKIHAMLGIEYRYLIIFTKKNDIHSTELENLKWVSLQTRTLTDEHDIPIHSYTPKRLPELDKKIKLEKREEKGYIYSVSELPLQIILVPKSKSIADYSETGTVIIALETYQTLVNFI